MPGAWLRHEAVFDAILMPYRIRADRIMVGMNVFLTLVCLSLSPWRGTYVAVAMIALPTLALSFWLAARAPGALWTRLFMGCAFMTYTALIIHQSGGEIEAHFAAFGLIGVLLYYRDWRTIVAATLFIYLHHLLLGYAQSRGLPVYVFNRAGFWRIFGLHVAYFLPFIAMMSYLAIWLRREGYESQYVIDLAQRIVQGNLVEKTLLTDSDADLPLVSAVRMMKARLLDLLHTMPVAAVVIRIDTDRVVSVNDAWRRNLGFANIDKTPFGESPLWSEAGNWSELLLKLRAEERRLLQRVELTLRREDGTLFLGELSLMLHEESAPMMAVLTIEDISARRAAELTMQRLAFRDMLTDLPNRTSLYAELDRAMSAWQAMRQPFALAMLDLDGFKAVNDRHGHDAGDKVLQVVAHRLQSLVRGVDLLARLGGDEFVVVLRECADMEMARQAAQRFLEIGADPIVLDEPPCNCQVGVSIGLAHCDGCEGSIEGLLRQADAAMYQAKLGGKQHLAVFATGSCEA